MDFLEWNVWISINISLKFVPKGPINNIHALVQIMAWHRPGDKPLSEPMLIILLTHICVTRPQWVNLKDRYPWRAGVPHFLLCFYQTRSAWSRDQRSTWKRSAVHNFAPTVMKFCVMWEGLSLPHDTKFGNCRGEIVDRRMILIWSLIHG